MSVLDTIDVIPSDAQDQLIAQGMDPDQAAAYASALGTALNPIGWGILLVGGLIVISILKVVAGR